MKTMLLALASIVTATGCDSETCITDPVLSHGVAATGTGYLRLSEANGRIFYAMSMQWPWPVSDGSSHSSGCFTAAAEDKPGSIAVGWIDADPNLCTLLTASCAPKPTDPQGTVTFTLRAGEHNVLNIALTDP